MTTKVVKGKTPYELLYGKAPIYDHLITFGYLCFMATPNKEEINSSLEANLVYSWATPLEKAYKVMDLESHKFHVSKDVVFQERVHK